MPTQVSSLPVPPASLALLADRLEDVPHLPPQQELARWLIASQVYHTKQQMDQVLLDRSRAYVTSPDFRLNYFFLR